MPPTTLVVALALVGLVLVLLIFRGRGKAEQPPRFEPPKEIAKRPPKDAALESARKSTAPDAAAKEKAAPTAAEEDVAASKESEAGPAKADSPPLGFPTAPPPGDDGEDREDREDPTQVTDRLPPSTEEIAADQILDTTPLAAKAEKADKPTPRASVPPPLPRGMSRAPLRSYSSISDESVAEEIRASSVPGPPDAPAADAKATAATAKPGSEPKLGTSPRAPVSEPKVATPKGASAPKVATATKPVSEPRLAAGAKPVSEPRLATGAKPVSEPKVATAAKLTSEARVATAPARPEDHDFSALNEPAKASVKTEAAAPVGRFVPPSNPATAELEKEDPRHAAARRLARISVSEIKLYHEEEVKAGREAKDLYKRLGQDIALAKQTFEARVVEEVRLRFDYLYDEILRQLAEGDVEKLGRDAPPPPKTAVASGTVAAAAPAAVEHEAPTKTAFKTLDEPDAAPPPAAAHPVSGTTVAAKPADAPKPAGAASVRNLPAANPETAELEKTDPRHAAARRLARLSVSEIKLYHEDEVRAGREAKDLWKRMSADIGLAVQTFEKRVDKEVRARFDYLYDEILRQLAEGDATKLGPDAPKPKAPVIVAEAEAAPANVPPPANPNPTPKPVEAVAAAPTAASGPGAAIAARYAPAVNPATAELEKSDPRHAAARRLARLSVSEIKLYHEDEVKAGRQAKDLWKRLMADIGLATQTYEKRVDKEVRARFDYLYDEILRQLAEGDATKLGPDAPKRDS